MSHLLEGIYDGSTLSTACVKSSYLGFCGGYDYVLERLATNVDRSVDTVRVINTFEMLMDGDAAASFGLYEVSGAGRDLEDHVSGLEANDGVGICVEVVHEPVCLFHGVCGSFDLLESYLVEGDEDEWVNLAVDYEGAIDGLDVGDTFWV